MGISARLKKVKPGYRAVSVLAGAAVFGAAAFFATTGANADTQPLPTTFDYRPAGDKAAAKTLGSGVHNKLPNVRRATTTEYKLGKTGPAFAPKAAAPRIVGGTPAATSDHPYIVGIRTIYFVDEGGPEYQGYQSTCTGTVISPTKVLTAGHCSYDSPLGVTYVFAGRTNLDVQDSGFATIVRSTFTHQGFDLNAGVPNNDVAVLTLRDPLPSVYTPIPLAAQGDETVYADNTPAKIVGYGLTAQNSGDDGILREADVPIRSDNTCSSALSGYLNATMACAGVPGKDTCNGDSGGPLIMTKGGVKTEVGVTSWGPAQCGVSYGAYAQVSTYSDLVKADIGRKSPNNLDWTGDGHSDLMARDGNGNLLLYSGSGLLNNESTNAFTEDHPWIGVGWNGFRKVFRVFDWTNNRKPSVFGVDGNGDLWNYPGTGDSSAPGQGGFDPAGRTKIGNGWAGFNDIMVTNNWTGNGRPNLLGRLPNGDLYLYTSDGNGGWENGGIGQRIGVGWGSFNTILTPGEWKGDGRQALIGRTPGGDLFLYQSDGHGGWVNGGIGQRIGVGWNSFNIFMSPGDFNGDNLVDLIGITPGGQLRLYETDGVGNWLTPLGLEIGTGWNAFNAVF